MLLFASEKEPRPKKPTAQEVMQREAEASMERAVLDAQEQQQRREERTAAELKKKWEKERPLLIAVCSLVALAVLAPIVYAVWYIFSHP
jgi:uncharacterized membrane protein YcjF (UPF0283 family)